MLFTDLSNALCYLDQLLIADHKNTANSKYDVIDNICAWIKDNYRQQIRLKHLSELFHISEPYICELFRSRMGITLTEYIRDIRMEKASYLLTETSMMTSEVAEEVGYSDYGYFGRIFKRYFNQTPMSFRREHQ